MLLIKPKSRANAREKSKAKAAKEKAKKKDSKAKAHSSIFFVSVLLSKDFFWLFLLVARGVNLLSVLTGQSQSQIFRKQKTPSCCHGKRPDFYR